MAAVDFYAGVPHLKGDPVFNRALSSIARGTHGSDARVSFGGFSALLDLKRFGFRDPLLTATTDGVGTKLELARLTGKHGTIGIDLVAMSVNDLITSGARPLFFLDYFAAGAFDRNRTLEVIRGIARGCKEAGCALVGGETAIMPGFYARSTYDLAGFAIGAVERSQVVDGRKIKAGDRLLGIASSGFHSNGYTLLRKMFSRRELSGKIGIKLLTPTRIYAKSLLRLIEFVPVDGIANITGGGLIDNIPRQLPKGLGARIMKGSWPVDPLFGEVQKRARYSEAQMFRTFNMGIGMVVILREESAARAQKILSASSERCWPIGVVQKGSGVEIE